MYSTLQYWVLVLTSNESQESSTLLSIKNSLLISLMRDDNRRLRDVSAVRKSIVSGSSLIREVDGVSVPSSSLLSPVGDYKLCGKEAFKKKHSTWFLVVVVLHVYFIFGFFFCVLYWFLFYYLTIKSLFNYQLNYIIRGFIKSMFIF